MHIALTDAQQSLLNSWLGEWQITADYSWPLQDTTVLRVRSRARDFIVKASQSSHHIEREIAAHEGFLGPFRGQVPTLVDSSTPDRILLAEYLPGTLVEGTPAEDDPATYRNAGAMLARLLIPGQQSTTYVREQVASVRTSLSSAGGLVPAPALRELEGQLSAVVDEPVPLSFTHGDYQPRNWLIHDAQLRVIDFGRAAQRHWTSDLVRLDNQQFVERHELEDAFMSGLGRPLSNLDQRMLQLASLQQAIGTLAWAHGIGDSPFEDQGRQMIARLLAVSP